MAAAVLNSHQPLLYDDLVSQSVATAADVTTRYSRYLYPPFFAVMLRPIAGLSFRQGIGLWFVFNLSLFSFAIAQLLSIARIRFNLKWLIFFVFLGLAFPPVRLHLMVYGQSNLILLLLITLFYLNSRPGSSRNSQIIAGLMLGIAIGIKLFMVVLVPYCLFFQRRRIALWAIAGFALTILIGIVGGGLQNSVYYFGQVLPGLLGGKYDLFWMNFSLGATIERMFTPVTFGYRYFFMQNPVNATIAPLMDAANRGPLVSSIARASLAGITIATLAAAWIVSRRRGVDVTPYGVSVGFLLVASLLLIPLGWAATQVLILLPVALLFSERGRSALYPQARNSLLLIASALILANSSWTLLHLIFGQQLPWWILTLGALGILIVWALFGLRIWIDLFGPQER